MLRTKFFGGVREGGWRIESGKAGWGLDLRGGLDTG